MSSFSRYGSWLATLALFAACGGEAGDASTVTTSSTTIGSGGATSTGGAGGTTGSGGDAGGNGSGRSPEAVYELDSKLTPGKSAISYAGQSLRHVLVDDMKAYIGGLTQAIDDDAYSPTTIAETVLALNYYYAFDGQTSGADPIALKTSPGVLQTSYDQVAKGKMLKDKMAGNDAATDHKDWSKSFVGWSDPSVAANGGTITSPEGLLLAFFHTLGKQALDRENATIPNEPGTNKPITKIHVTATGLDLQQLIQKHLLMGVSYSQGTDDYLDDDVADKGLLAPNTQDGANPYTVLGHGWDEAFGYFGAARDYPLYGDDELAAKGGRPDWQGYHDTNGDSKIDLTEEYNFGAAATAAKRDLGAVEPTDFTRDAFTGFLNGRLLLHDAGDSLTTGELEGLKGYRDQAVLAWERAIAATVVHYLNATIAHTLAIDGSGYDFYAHAKEWSELKGFALGLQFNPRKKLTDEQFKELHTLIKDAPVLSTKAKAERDQYRTDLVTARALIQVAYGFTKTNVEGW